MTIACFSGYHIRLQISRTKVKKKTLLFDMINALILEEIMCKSRLKSGLLCKNKIGTIFY